MLLCLWQTNAGATQQYSITQINPLPGTQFVMGSTQLITFRITNNNTNPNTGERIYYVQFQTVTTGWGNPRRYTTFNAAATTAPANWSKSTSASTSIIFQPNTYANAIPQGGFQDFTISVYMGSRSADFTETLRRARVRYTTTAAGICCPSTYTQTGNTITVNNPANLPLRCLSIALRTTDCGGTAITTLTAGNNFCLEMTVQNFSSTAKNGIVSSPTNPPAGPPPPSNANIATIGTAVPVCNLTTNSPLNLAVGAGPGYVGASGTITFRYPTAGTDNGTIQFVNLIARQSATATSPLANSNILTVSRVTVGIVMTGPRVASSNCIFVGDVVTSTMTITNGTGAAITNVTPSALTQCAYPPCTGAVTLGAFALTSPNCIPNIAINKAGTFTWTAPITGGTINNPQSSVTVTGNVNYNKAACGVGGGTTSVTANSNALDLDGYIVTVSPATTNASSANEELTWTVENYGCASIQQVSISASAPAGWTWAGGDSYSLVGNADLETWTTGGANLPIDFNAPVGGQLPQGESGSFSLVFPTTPTPAVIPTPYVFNVSIADANATPIIQILPTTVTVNAFNSTPGGPNAAGTGVWKEIVQ